MRRRDSLEKCVSTLSVCVEGREEAGSPIVTIRRQRRADGSFMAGSEEEEK